MASRRMLVGALCAALVLLGTSQMSLINSITSLPEPAVPEQIVKLPSSWNVTASIPKKIHQCWKTADLPPWAASAGWQGSPGFEYKLWTDETMLRFVTDYYPQFLPLYNASRPVERADFFRYLILFDQGGYYSDLDVTLVVALNEWSGRHPGAKVFVGLERAPTGRNWNRWFARRFQIVQWTLASVPGHPIFHRVLMLIWQRWKQHGSRLYGNLSANVMDTTGPGIWSDAVSDVLRQRGIILGPSPLNASFVTQNGVREGEIVLLPQLGFGRTGNDVFSSSTLVQHEFQGSWKGVADFMPPKGFYDSDTKGGWENPLAEPGNTTIQDCGDRCLDFVGCKAYEVRHAKVGPCFLYGDLSTRFTPRPTSNTLIHRGLTHDAYTRWEHRGFKEYDGLHGVLMACESECESDHLCKAYGTSSTGGCTIYHEAMTEETVPANTLVMEKDFPGVPGYVRRRIGGYWANPGVVKIAANPAECSLFCDSDPACIAFEVHTDDHHCYTFQELEYPFSPYWFCKAYLKLKPAQKEGR